MIVFARSKTTFKNKSAKVLSAENKKDLLKTSFVLQNRIERVLLNLGNQLTKMNKVWRSQNHT